jgi:chorismate dehydratase
VRSFAALESLRIGCVQYLNAKPLIHSYPGGITFDHPARLADLLAAGELDAGLVPVFEALRHPEFRVVDDVAISARGPVYSVILAYRGSLKDVKSVTLDPASRTSSNLLRCLLAEFHGLTPCYFSTGGADAHLLIGDQAIRFRRTHGRAQHYLDLGEEWMRCTGLPFVFAVWLIRPEITQPGAVADALRALKRAGIERIGEIAREQRDSTFAEHYLRENIRYDLGAKEKTGIARFRELLIKHRLLNRTERELVFV